ncbi:CopG family transcriptional regulator [Brevundimonas aurantiaca]|jgi:predicted transcriptional regulator|uniref:CopG family transcriptional regulator n=1 Tax=Brevundimonas aurantiaca TaxID=74316 RepID=UPI001D8E1076|nr:CopG family transcriptional regulator [Alphaproteobacteria bacterium]
MADPAIDNDEEDLFSTPDDAADEAATLKGLADARAGRVVDNETVMRWVESWATANPLPRPKCG